MKKFLTGVFGIITAAFIMLFAEPYVLEYINQKLNPVEETSVITDITGEPVIFPEFVWVEPDIPWMHMIEGIPHIFQNDDYPTGCESISTVMALNYLGFDITPEEFIDDYLPKGEIYAEGEGDDKILYAPDPNEYFIGDPYDEHSLGCYAPVIQKAADEYLDDNWKVTNATGTEMNQLLRKYILNDIPVIFWATMNMQESREGNTWIVTGDDDEREFTWIAGEHCLVLTGYDGANYYFCDPSREEKITAYPRKKVEERYKELGMQCIVIEKVQ